MFAWQGCLDLGAPSERDASSDASATPVPQRVRLDSDSWVDVAANWLAQPDAVLAELLDTVSLRQREVVMYDRLLPEPRLTWWAELDDDPELSPALRGARVELERRYGVEFDSVGVNLYRTGDDSVTWHRDRDRLTVEDPLIAIVSIGTPRPFRMRPFRTRSFAGGGQHHSWNAGDGMLLVMGGSCQHDWEHCVPKTRRCRGPRMSITFRHGAR